MTLTLILFLLAAVGGITLTLYVRSNAKVVGQRLTKLIVERIELNKLLQNMAEKIDQQEEKIELLSKTQEELFEILETVVPKLPSLTPPSGPMLVDGHGLTDMPDALQQQLVSDMLSELWLHREEAGQPVPDVKVLWVPADNRFQIDVRELTQAPFYFVDLESPQDRDQKLQGIIVPFGERNQHHVVAVQSNGTGGISCGTQQLTPELLMQILQTAIKPLTH